MTRDSMPLADFIAYTRVSVRAFDKFSRDAAKDMPDEYVGPELRRSFDDWMKDFTEYMQ